MNKIIAALIIGLFSASLMANKEAPIRISMYAEDVTVTDFLESVNDLCQTGHSVENLKKPTKIISYDVTNLDCPALIKLVFEFDNSKRK